MSPSEPFRRKVEAEDQRFLASGMATTVSAARPLSVSRRLSPQVHVRVTGAVGLASGGERLLAVGHGNHGLKERLIRASRASQCVGAGSLATRAFVFC